MFRRIALWCGVFGVMLSATGGAQAQAPCPLPEDPEVILEFLWPLVDTNGDGGLSLGEAQAIYPELDAFYFSIADLDSSGRITKNELLSLLPLLGGDFLSLIDGNGDGVISYAEVSDYVTPAQFALLDGNSDGRIDCRDLETAPGEGEVEEGELTEEGETGEEGELPDLTEYCQYLPLVAQYFPTLDTNNSGGVSRDELQPVILLVPDYDIETGFVLLDADADGEITLAEINAVAAGICGGGEGEPEGSNEGEVTVPELGEFCQYASLVPALFPVIDSNGSGGVSQPELLAALSNFGVSLEAGEITLVFTIADTDQNGEISLAEFNAVAEVACGGGEGEPEGEPEGSVEGEGEGGGGFPGDLEEICQYLPLVPALFPSVDADQSGGISQSELTAVLGGLGVSLEAGEILLIYAVADTDQDGEISLAEFDTVAVLACGGTEGEPEGSVEGEPEGQFEGEFDLTELCVYLPLVESAFDSVDTDASGGISLAELQSIVVVLVLPSIDMAAAFEALDLDSSGEVTREEVAALAAQVCPVIEPDGEVEGEDPGEGEVEGEPDGEDILALLCGQLPLVEALFPMADTDQDGALTLAEVEAALSSIGLFVGDASAIFAALDLDTNGGVTLAELAAVHADYCGLETGGEGLVLSLARQAGANNRYVAGETLRVTVTLTGTGGGTLSALGLAETLPEGWSIAAVVDDAGAESAPAAGAEGTVEFAWLTVPSLPATVVYDVAVPAEAAGAAVIAGEALYRVGESEELGTGSLATLLLPAGAPLAQHAGDPNGDWRISLSEVLRVIQLYNLLDFHCDVASEDGYAPGAEGDQTCAPHTSDYNPQNWRISLSELLRIIQLFNVNDGYYYASGDTEDGYAPGFAAE